MTKAKFPPREDSRPLFEELERRVLLSADLEPVLLDPSQVDPGDAASFATIDSIARNILEGGKPTINFVHIE